MCPPALYCCVRLCLAILYICLPALDVAGSSFDFEKHKLFGVYGGVICPAGSCGRVCGWLVSHVLSFVSHFFHLSPSSFHFWSPKLGACGRVPGWLVSHFLSFVSYFFSLVSFPFICLPGSVLVVGFPAGLSPTSFPTSFHLSLSSFHCLSGWVLVVAGLRLACLPLPFICLPLPFICLPLLFICLPLLIICLPGWVLVVGFPAGLSPTSFHMSPTSFHLSPWVLVVGFAAGLPRAFICLPLLSFASQFFSFVSHFFSFPKQFTDGLVGFPAGLSPTSFVSQFFSVGVPLACLPLPFICLPILFICFPGHFLSFVSHFFSLSPRLGACGRVPGRLVSHFVSFVSHFFSFVSQAGCLWSGFRPACLPLPFICLPLLFCLWSGSRPACLPLPLICLPLLFICHQLLFICLPGWVLVVGFPPYTCFHFSPGSFHLSPRNACGRVPGPLVSHLLSFVSRFFSFISQKCFICLPGPSLLVPCSISIHLSLSLLISALFRWPCSISIHLSPRLVTGGVRPFPLFLFICLPGLSLLVSALFRWPCSISIHLPPRLVTGGVRPFPLFLFICLPGLSLLVSALFRWPCSIFIHLCPRSVTASVLSPRSVTAGVRPFRRPCSISIH